MISKQTAKLHFKKVRYLLGIFILFFYGLLNAQDRGLLEGTSARIFELISETDTIQFLKLDSELTERKPVVLLLQGSLPIPLAIKYPEGTYLTSFPFSTQELVKDYHVVVISMPHIPIQLESSEVSSNASMKDFPAAYNRDNYLDKYVTRANKVIDFLKEEEWVSKNEFIVFGHSQGSSIATKLAISNSFVSKLGLSSFNPYGRFKQYIKEIRVKEHKGLITSEEAQLQIEEYYKRWAYISQNRNDDSQVKGDTYKATFSFSEDLTDDLLSIDIPVYLMYGTRDVGSSACDFLPLEFISNGKNNYTIKAYPGLGHNYEEVDSEGRSNFEKMYWQEAFDEFQKWLEIDE